MGLGELLDGIFSLYRRNFVLIAAISALVQVPFAALRYLAFQLSGYVDLQNRLQGASNSLSTGVTPSNSQLQDLLGLAGTVLLVSLVIGLVNALIVQPLAVAATTRAVSDRYLDRAATIGASYAAALRRLGALILQSFILFAGAIVLGAVVVLVVALFAAASLLHLALHPILAARESAEARLQKKEALVAEIKANAETLKAELAAAPSGPAIPAATALTQEAATRGISLQRLDREGGRLRVGVDSVRHADLIAWLDSLERVHGLRVVGADIERRPAPGMVSARLSFED